MKYLTRSNDEELAIETLEKAKEYFIKPKDHILRAKEHELREEYDNYYTELENADTLEEFAEIWNTHTDICEDGSRLLIKFVELWAETNPLMGLFRLDAETLDEAKEKVDEMVSYTQCPVSIYEVNERHNRKEVARREWYGSEIEDEDDYEKPISFGALGYYSDWVDYD